eukprot:gene20127-20674_t
MWAGGRLAFVDPLRLGDEVSKTSIIEDVALKAGRSGQLIFVTVRHVYATARGRAVEERQDIVYRPPEVGAGDTRTLPAASSTTPVAIPPARCDPIDATPTLLFRYSALTFNGHRIHYDLAYATGEEGYPGLVVHGPLQATYLLRLATDLRGGTLPRDFEFRSVRPLFAGSQMTINALTADPGTELWIADPSGRKTMTASASY